MHSLLQLPALFASQKLPYLCRHSVAARSDQVAVGAVITLADGLRQRITRHDVPN